MTAATYVPYQMRVVSEAGPTAARAARRAGSPLPPTGWLHFTFNFIFPVQRGMRRHMRSDDKPHCSRSTSLADAPARRWRWRLARTPETGTTGQSPPEPLMIRSPSQAPHASFGPHSPGGRCPTTRRPPPGNAGKQTGRPERRRHHTVRGSGQRVSSARRPACSG